jgi:hypothetical protein
MLKTPFPFCGEFVVACAYTQNAKFVRHMHVKRVNGPLKSNPKPHRSTASICHLFLI